MLLLHLLKDILNSSNCEVDISVIVFVGMIAVFPYFFLVYICKMETNQGNPY